MILSANWASPAQQAVVIVTDDRGPVLVTTEADQQALDSWIADGGTVGSVPLPGLAERRAAAPKIKVSRFLAQAVTRQWMTEAEAKKFAKQEDLPAVVVAAKDAVCAAAHPNDEAARAAMSLEIEMDLYKLSHVGRLDLLVAPMVQVLANLPEPITVTDADLDVVFGIEVP